MAQPILPKQTSEKTGKERRAHARYPILVKATIMLEEVGEFSATAKDFCVGGLFINFDKNMTLPAAETLCLVQLNINNEQYQLKAKIAHAEPGSAGISFINPEKITLKALQNHAVKYNRALLEEHKNNTQEKKQEAPDFNGKSTQQLISLCNEHVHITLEQLLYTYFEHVTDDLLISTKENSDSQEVNDSFMVIENIDKEKSRFTNAYLHAIDASLQGILNEPKQIDESANDNYDVSIDSLAIVDDEEFNIWLAKYKIINRVEIDCLQELGCIERRLSLVYGKPIDKQNNPYGPALFVDTFQNYLDILCAHKSLINVCYNTFRTSLLKSIGYLYENINKTLIENNVAPDMKILSPIKIQKENAEDNTDKNKQPETTETESEQSKPTETQSKNASPVSDVVNKVDKNEKITQQNLFDLVGELRNLQTQLRQQAPANSNQGVTSQQAGVEQSTVPSPSPNLPTFSTEQITNLISNLKSPVSNTKGDGQSLAVFREQLETHLGKQADDDKQRVLSKKHNQVIDISESIFHALLNDLQVAQSVRPWIEELGVPVMMMALKDEKIFTDKSHVVRQVINKLADLEILASTNNKGEQAAVKQAFGWLTNLIRHDFDGTDKVFHRAVQQLNILTKVQQDAYERNIKEVVNEVIQKEPEQEQQTEATEEEKQKEKDDQWLRQVHRLQEGSWVVFDAYSDEPKRLKVAWIAQRKGKFVFVNVMGQKDRIVKDEELARQFEEGSAVILDGQDDPAMDRAQYTMLQNLHKQLIYQTTHDELTGLINRREFEIAMQHAVNYSLHSNAKHAVVYIELDQFKLINNSFGYEAGDLLLKEIVGLISEPLNEHNIMARIGTDQFSLLLQETSMDDAIELIEDLMDEIHEYRFSWQETNTSVTFSAGVAMITSATENVLNLLQEAESSCSVAREMGGNRIQIYHAGSGRISRRKKEMEWATKIDKALDEGELFLRCQKISPILNTDINLPHYEILLGLSDNLGGQESLEEFIRAAELYNRMGEIDKWVIATAFKWLADNEHTVNDISVFTINLSGQSFNDDELINFIYQKVNETGVPIERVCFEITETAGISNLSDAADFIQTIKDTGCKFALDDFGSGMSSYSYLKNLPVDYLKIDGVFIKDIVNNPSDFAVTKSICEIGHFMEKTVIAEFVQDENTVEILKSIGVDYAQGYGISKPHRLDDLLS